MLVNSAPFCRDQPRNWRPTTLPAPLLEANETLLYNGPDANYPPLAKAIDNNDLTAAPDRLKPVASARAIQP